MRWAIGGWFVALMLSVFPTGCYLSHELSDDSDPSDPTRPFPTCDDDTTPDLQIRITVDVGDLPSTDAGGPLLTWLEGSCGDEPIEGREERRGLVWWRDLDRRCAPYRVTLALEGVGARSFYEVRQSFCGSVTFGRERGSRGAGSPDPELSSRGGSMIGLAPGEGVVLLGPELIRGWVNDAGGELHYRDRDGPYDVYGLVYEERESEYVAMDGTPRRFRGGRPLRVARAWGGDELPAHGFTLDVSGDDVPLTYRRLRLRFGDHIGSGGPRYAEGQVRGLSELARENAPGTAALQPTGPETLEGDIPLFPSGPWGSARDLESVTAFDDAGTPIATVLLTDDIEDVTVLDVAEPPRFSGEYFSEAAVAFPGTSWPLARLTISDGPHRWIVTYLQPTDAVELDPADLPLPAGMDYTDGLAFMPPFAYVKVEWVEPLGTTVAPISDRNPTPAVVVASETREFVYDLDEEP